MSGLRYLLCDLAENHVRLMVGAVLGFCSLLYADYGQRLRNIDLKAQLENEDSVRRSLPQSALLSIAADNHFFYRMSDSFPGYYHGGYWSDFFVELRPLQKLTANSRLIFYNPAMSYGIASTFYLHPLVGFSWKDNLTDYGLPAIGVHGRLYDLGRQTLGAGLTFDSKEMSGLRLDLTASDFRFAYLFHGTGGYQIDGDIHYIQLDYLDDLVGIYAFSQRPSQPAFFGAYSKKSLSKWLGYRLEGSQRNSRCGALGALSIVPTKSDTFSVEFELQGRWYEKDFAAGLVGQIEHDYLAVDQENKWFTDSANIFTVADNVVVAAARLKLSYRPIPAFHLFTDNEIARNAYKDAGTLDFYFFKHGAGWCPLRTKNACGYLVYSNKMSNAIAPISQLDRVNKYSFLMRNYLGLEAWISF